MHLLQSVLLISALQVSQLWTMTHADECTADMQPVRPQLVIFGDSLTQQSFGHGGWGAALANNYARKVCFMQCLSLCAHCNSRFRHERGAIAG
jgi:hypothetical protein